MKEEYGKFLECYSLFSMPNHRRILKLKTQIDNARDKEDIEEIYKTSAKVNKMMKTVENHHPLRQAWEKFMMCLVKGKYGGYYEIYGNEEVLR